MKRKIVLALAVAGVLVLSALETVFAQGIIITNGASLIANDSVNLVINNGGFTNNGNFFAGSSRIVFRGNTATANSFISGSGTGLFYDLVLNKSVNGLTLNTDISVANRILFTSGDSIFLNNHIIDLGNSGSLTGEAELMRITGMTGGYIQVNQNLNAPTAVNPGNLGIEISSSVNLGNTIIRRGHKQQGGGSINRYFDLLPMTNTGLNATLSFRYFDAELGGVGEGNLGVFCSANAGINWNGIGVNALNVMLNILTKDGIDSLNRFTLANLSDPLAFTLLFLKANLVERQILLTWATATESDNERFDIERSADGRNFMALTSVQGGGNNNSIHYYMHTDKTPIPGMNYYRLKQTDNYRRIKYSYIVAANSASNLNGMLSIFPNPALDKINLSLLVETGNNYKIIITDLMGKVVQSQMIICLAGLNRVEIDVSMLSSGIYIISSPNLFLNGVKLLKK